LEKADEKITVIIKDILHLHPSTTDYVLYIRKRDEGMRIHRLPQLVHFTSLRSGLALLKCGDEAVQAAASAQSLEDCCKKVAQIPRLYWPVTPKDLGRASRLNKSQEIKKWRNLPSQGQKVQEFCNDPLGNSWLYDPSVLSTSRYKDALRLRTNTFGVNVALRRADKDLPVDCRRCHINVNPWGTCSENVSQVKACGSADRTRW
jgi:hypothetical protein